LARPGQDPGQAARRAGRAAAPRRRDQPLRVPGAGPFVRGARPHPADERTRGAGRGLAAAAVPRRPLAATTRLRPRYPLAPLPRRGAATATQPAPGPAREAPPLAPAPLTKPQTRQLPDITQPTPRAIAPGP